MDKLKLYKLEKLLNQKPKDSEKDAIDEIEEAKKSLNFHYVIKLNKEGDEEKGIKYSFPLSNHLKKKEKKEEDIQEILKLLSKLHEKALLNDDDYIYYFKKFLSLYIASSINDKFSPWETLIEKKLLDFSSLILEKRNMKELFKKYE